MVHEGRILLIKGVSADRDLDGLWSLPLADAREHETCEQAGARSVEERVGLNVCVSRRVLVHDRQTSRTTLFALSLAGHSTDMHAPATQEHEFFEFNGLPQHIDVDSLLCVIRYRINEPSTDEHLLSVIDRVFASIFYSHLACHFKHPDIDRDVDCHDEMLYRSLADLLRVLPLCNDSLLCLFQRPAGRSLVAS